MIIRLRRFCELARRAAILILPPVVSRKRAARTLRILGYLPPKFKVEPLDFDRGVKKFREFNGLAGEGGLDRETLLRIFTPRCGVQDPEGYFSWAKMEGGEPSLGTAGPCPWEGKGRGSSFFYWFEDTPDEYRTEVISAMNEWQAVDGIVNFLPAASRADSDFVVAWTPASGFGLDHDMEGNLIAHARFPCDKSVLPRPIHFDISEKWSLVPHDNCFTIYSIALHEIGHIIGLAHPAYSNINLAMDPYFPVYGDRKGLSEGDKDKLRELYPAII